MGNISPRNFILGQAFHRPLKPPFSWFVRVIVWAQAIARASCQGLNIYKKNELESTFIEIVNPKKSNIFVAVNYRHPSKDLTDFNCNYLKS